MNLQIRENTWDRVFDDFGFKIKRRAYDVTSYYNKEKDVWAQVDERLLTLEVGEVHLNYSVRELITELTKYRDEQGN